VGLPFGRLDEAQPADGQACGAAAGGAGGRRGGEQCPGGGQGAEDLELGGHQMRQMCRVPPQEMLAAALRARASSRGMPSGRLKVKRGGWPGRPGLIQVGVRPSTATTNRSSMAGGECR